MQSSSGDSAHTELQRVSALREAAINVTLDNANIVTTYTYDLQPLCGPSGSSDHQPSALWEGGPSSPLSTRFQDWQLIFIQEYCDGGTLLNMISGRSGLPGVHGVSSVPLPTSDMALGLLLQIALGCAYIHSKNIIHGQCSLHQMINLLLFCCCYLISLSFLLCRCLPYLKYYPHDHILPYIYPGDLKPDNVLLKSVTGSRDHSDCKWIAKVWIENPFLNLCQGMY